MLCTYFIFILLDFLSWTTCLVLSYTLGIVQLLSSDSFDRIYHIVNVTHSMVNRWRYIEKMVSSLANRIVPEPFLLVNRQTQCLPNWGPYMCMDSTWMGNRSMSSKPKWVDTSLWMLDECNVWSCGGSISKPFVYYIIPRSVKTIWRVICCLSYCMYLMSDSTPNNPLQTVWNVSFSVSFININILRSTTAVSIYFRRKCYFQQSSQNKHTIPISLLWPLLLKWFNFNPSMDK